MLVMEKRSPHEDHPQRALYAALRVRRLTQLSSCAGRAQRRTTQQLGV
jgi:hypothetical protein